MVPSQEVLKSILYYDEDTGILTWKHRAREMFPTDRSFSIWNKRFPGKRAGTVRTCKRFGYKNRWLKIFGKPVVEHRAIWVMMMGVEPPEEVDHKNRDATDNRWENLRLATHAENHRNRSRNSTNKSGMSGVHWDKECKKWRVAICLNGKIHHFGRHNSLQKAMQIAENFYRESGFDLEHGKHDTVY